MATLELSIDEAAAVSPVRRTRRLGLLFWMAIGWMTFVFALAAFADLLPLPSPFDMDMLERRAPMSAAHWLGTDGLGRDVLSRLIYGARISLIVGLYAPVIGLTIGGALGILAGYFRGRFETLVVGSMDTLLAFPPLILALAVTAYLGQSLVNLTAILGVIGIIVVEGALSFLGLGVPPPISSWGIMIGEGRESLEIAPRLAFIPAVTMFLTVLSFNLVGDTLRALTDPRQGAL